MGNGTIVRQQKIIRELKTQLDDLESLAYRHVCLGLFFSMINKIQITPRKVVNEYLLNVITKKFKTF